MTKQQEKMKKYYIQPRMQAAQSVALSVICASGEPVSAPDSGAGKVNPNLETDDPW